ncbi:hypothetical protein FRB93_012583 [Tulasnella sp. JGI-2019a]|nr:hypothetical protein FRB93_012583 [Tulasnella sp. JGI-2019a]
MWMHPTVKGLTFTEAAKGAGSANRDMKVSEFIAEMARLCPDLVDLTLWVPKFAAKPIRGLRSLRTVDLGGCDITTVLFELANLPAVERLTIRHPPSLPSQWPQWIIIPFPRLEMLDLSAPYSDASTFLHTLAIGESRLKELMITGTGHLGDLEMLMRAAGEHQYLERLAIHTCDIASLSPLEHIFPCSFLTSLTLYAKGDIRMADEDLGILGIGLPGIVHIRLRRQGSTRLTLRALSIAIMSWPYLETLSLQIDVGAAVPPEGHPAPHKHLQTLHLIDSLAPEPAKVMKVAWFIVGLSDADGFQLEFYENRIWDLVKELLPELRSTRREA